PRHRRPLAVVDLVEEHELAWAELATDDGLEALLVDAAELLHGTRVLLDRGGPDELANSGEHGIERARRRDAGWLAIDPGVAWAAVMRDPFRGRADGDSEPLPGGGLEIDEGCGRMNDALCPERLGFGFYGVAVGDGQLEPGSSLGGLVGERVIGELDAEARP